MHEKVMKSIFSTNVYNNYTNSDLYWNILRKYNLNFYLSDISVVLP